MKKYLLLLFTIASLSSQAQIFPDGTVITSFSATDINNNFFSSTATTNTGKHFIIDISATWCGICWNYHNTKVLNDYYSAYGHNGTVAQDADVMFYEGDQSTNNNDLNGVGTNTVGDWVTGTNYRIFNEGNPAVVRSSFANNGALGYPSVFVVCSDNKMYRLATSLTAVADVRNFVDDKCGTAPLSINSVQAASFSYEVYPNPTSGNISLDLHIDKQADISYALYSTIGQKVLGDELKNGGIENMIKLNTAELQNGLYYLTIRVGNEKVTEKIVVQ